MQLSASFANQMMPFPILGRFDCIHHNCIQSRVQTPRAHKLALKSKILAIEWSENQFNDIKINRSIMLSFQISNCMHKRCVHTLEMDRNIQFCIHSTSRMVDA
jgi:hypothetical protein